MIGTLEKTPQNDYLAADGKWYPSDKLDGYFKDAPRRSAFEEAAFLEMNEVFKQIYGDLIKDLFHDNNPLLVKIK